MALDSLAVFAFRARNLNNRSILPLELPFLAISGRLDTTGTEFGLSNLLDFNLSRFQQRAIIRSVLGPSRAEGRAAVLVDVAGVNTIVGAQVSLAENNLLAVLAAAWSAPRKRQ